eukprot:3543782-Karenia_brevis.AAC.1
MRAAPASAIPFPLRPTEVISTSSASSAGPSSSSDAGLPQYEAQPPAGSACSSSSLSDSSSDGSQPSVEDEFCEALLAVSSLSWAAAVTKRRVPGMVHQVSAHDNDGITTSCGRSLSRQCDIFLNWAS